MATFKHISSKNADYGAAEQYLTFEHDEFTMKPTLDGNGQIVPRTGYIISSLNCGDEDFAIACMRSNLKYGKNQRKEDVNSHHYIISFDPRDAQDNGLTVDRAQELGEQFCKEHFPGHQALVCTHPDGHNHSGNIHVHIVINSLRIAEVPLLPYMERPADTKEGCKHRCTDVAMEYFKAEVMEMCHRENLYQIDLLNGSKNRVTEREYFAKRKGQAALDKENSALAAKGEPPRQTKFETDKEKLRIAIRAALSSAISFEEFSGKLLQQGVTVKESRGRLSYLTPNRTKPITALKLGDDFDRTAVLALLEHNAQNAARAAEKPLPKQNTPPPWQHKRPFTGQQSRHKRSETGRSTTHGRHCRRPRGIVKRPYRTESRGKHFKGEKGLAETAIGVHQDQARRDGLKAQKTEKARKNYREQHESDFMIAEAATRYFKTKGISKLPASKTLQAEIEQLMREKNSLYNEYREKREKTKELQTVKGNIEQILRSEPGRGKGRNNER